jgi:hypothetical protein
MPLSFYFSTEDFYKTAFFHFNFPSAVALWCPLVDILVTTSHSSEEQVLADLKQLAL